MHVINRVDHVQLYILQLANSAGQTHVLYICAGNLKIANYPRREVRQNAASHTNPLTGHAARGHNIGMSQGSV